MLQQTQVVTAIPYYHRWLERFPTVEALASASMQDLLALWQGLGLYRRAHNLQRCAKMVVEKWGGVFPRSVEGLRELPGVGRYTAGAVASFAYNLPAPVVDGNVARVLSRLLDLQEPIDTPVGQAILWDAAERIAQCEQPRLVNNALMELGAVLCKAGNPACGLCPVRRACGAIAPETLPRKRPQPPTQARVEHYWWFYDGARVLLEQRQATARWGGLWTLPVLDADSPSGLATFVSLRHHIMRFLVDLQVVRGDHASLPQPPAASRLWQPVAMLDEVPMPTPHRRVIGLALAAESARL
jgi:A/G-specific adenine glycosylase